MDTDIDTDIALNPPELIGAIHNLERESKQIRDSSINYKDPLTPEEFIDKYPLVDEINANGFAALEYATRIYAQMKGKKYVSGLLNRDEQEILSLIGGGISGIPKKTKTNVKNTLKQLGDMIEFMGNEDVDEQTIAILRDILTSTTRDSLPYVYKHLPDGDRTRSTKLLAVTLNIPLDDITQDSEIHEVSYGCKIYTLDEKTRGISELDNALITAIYTHFEQKRKDEQNERYQKIEDISILSEMYESTLISLVDDVGNEIDKEIEQLNTRLGELKNNKKEVDDSIEEWMDWHIDKYTAQTTDAIESKENYLHDNLLSKTLLKHISTIIKGADNTVSDAHEIYACIDKISREPHGETISVALQYLKRKKQREQLRTCADLKGNIELAELYNTLESEENEIKAYVNSKDFYKMPEIQPKKRALDRIQSMITETNSTFNLLNKQHNYLSSHS